MNKAPAKLYMPHWDFDEILQVAEVCSEGEDVSEDEVTRLKNRFEFFGGHARWCHYFCNILASKLTPAPHSSIWEVSCSSDHIHLQIALFASFVCHQGLPIGS